MRIRGKKKEMVSVVLLFLLVAATGLLVGIGTAYFSDMEKAENMIDVGDSNLEIIEEFTPPVNPKPGDRIAKKVNIKNKGKSNCFIRCRILLDNEDILPYLTLQVNKADWEETGDGYYYFKYARKAGDMTSDLLSHMILSENVPAELLEQGFSVTVYAESYQQGSFAEDAWKDAWEYFGRNVKRGGARDI